MAKKKKEYSFSRFVKDFDFFGYPVQLNFDEKGSTHQTCCGGLASFVFVALVLVVVFAQVAVASSNSQSMFFTHEYPFDSEQMTSSVMTDATLGLGTLLYIVDTKGDTPVPVSIAKARQYLSISYVDESGASTAAVVCDQTYFSDTVAPTETSQSVYDQFLQYSEYLFCPDSSSGLSPLNMTLQVRCKNCGDELIGMSVVTMMFASKVNMANQDYPLFSYPFSTGSFDLDKRKKYFHTVPLRFNQMVLHDKPFGLGGQVGATVMSFFDNQYADQGPIIIGANDYGSPITGQTPSKLLVSQSFKISSLAQMHHKRIYTFWIWLALVGGIIYSLVQSFTWCIRPCARHGFVMRAMKRLYLVRTKDETLFKVNSNDPLRYQRDFDEIHEDPNWPIVTDPFDEVSCGEDEEVCDSVNDQNFGVQQPQHYQDEQYEGGGQGSKQSKHSPRFVNGQGNSSRADSKSGRNPRSKKTYYEDTPHGDQSVSQRGSKNSKLPQSVKNLKNQANKNVQNGKNVKNGMKVPVPVKKPATQVTQVKKTGRKVALADNPVLEKCSTAVQEEIAIHRVPRIYNTKWCTMLIGNMIRSIICCSQKTCDCCCDCCFSSLKQYKVYDETVRRLDEEMDIVKILKKMRNMQVMMNSTHVNTEKTRFKLTHTFHNIIDLVESDDEFCKLVEQDRKMKIQALDGEELPSGVEDNHRNQPFTPTMGQNEPEDSAAPPTFEQEVDKNIDHQVLFHGYPVGIPCCPPVPPPRQAPPQPVYYKEMPQEKTVVHAHATVKKKESYVAAKEQHPQHQQERFVKKQQNSHSPVYQRQAKPRGSAGEQQYSYDDEDYDDECYSSDRQRYYNERNASQVRQNNPVSNEKDHIPVHDYRQDQTHHKKPDPQEDLYQEQRKMTLPKYKQGKKFDQSQKNPNAVLNKYNRFEVEER